MGGSINGGTQELDGLCLKKIALTWMMQGGKSMTLENSIWGNQNLLLLYVDICWRIRIHQSLALDSLPLMFSHLYPFKATPFDPLMYINSGPQNLDP